MIRVLEVRDDLVAGRVPGYGGRTLLHVVADWPGYTPRGPQVVRLLIERGANPNVRGDDDEHGESPLHWAASSDDVDVARALLDGGADMELASGSIGTPLDNAIGYGSWHVAELLAQRGARVEKLWHAAALGRLDILEDLLADAPEQDAVSQAFWHACAAGQRRSAQRLARGRRGHQLDARLCRGHAARRGRRSIDQAGERHRLADRTGRARR